FAIGITVDYYLGESVYHYDHGSIRLMAFLAHWKEGRLNCLIHDQYAWVDIPDLIHYNFSPADVPFVQRILIGDILLN
ncbi:MAG: hypothetical protein JW902_16505, partial [Syntrophaceae bacterium]|nr:hypothetical protein [Syntrophaceae bacterium]